MSRATARSTSRRESRACGELSWILLACCPSCSSRRGRVGGIANRVTVCVCVCGGCGETCDERASTAGGCVDAAAEPVTVYRPTTSMSTCPRKLQRKWRPEIDRICAESTCAHICSKRRRSETDDRTVPSSGTRAVKAPTSSVPSHVAMAPPAAQQHAPIVVAL